MNAEIPVIFSFGKDLSFLLETRYLDDRRMAICNAALPWLSNRTAADLKEGDVGVLRVSTQPFRGARRLHLRPGTYRWSAALPPDLFYNCAGMYISTMSRIAAAFPGKEHVWVYVRLEWRTP